MADIETLAAHKFPVSINKLRTFQLFYRYRNMTPLSLIWEMNGDLKAAIDRGRRHCEVMNYKFIVVRPFIVDLDEREKRRNEVSEDYSVDY